jgi:hypothetical protein
MKPRYTVQQTEVILAMMLRDIERLANYVDQIEKGVTVMMGNLK